MIHSQATGRNLLARGPFGQGGQDLEKPRMGRIEVDLLIAGTGGSIDFQGNPAHAIRLLVIWGG